MNGSENEAEPPLSTPGNSIQVTSLLNARFKRREVDSALDPLSAKSQKPKTQIVVPVT